MKPPVMRGEMAPNAKLTQAQVQEIRDLAAAFEHQRKIAAVFGISQSAVSLIVNNIN